MKRIITYVVLIILCVSLGVIGLLNKPGELPDARILNKDFYKYNKTTGNYEELKITSESISYNGEELNLATCKEYTYDKETNILKLDCGKAFRLDSYVDNVLIINVDNKDNYFYESKENSFNGEFQRTFGMTLDSYKVEGEEGLIDKKIDIEKLKEIMEDTKESYIYLKSNVCNLNCTLFNKAFLNMGNIEASYYLDLDDLTDEDYEELKESYQGFLETKEDYIEEYPIVLKVENKIVKETLKIEIKGFDITKYDNYFDKEVNNEENN